MSDWATEMDKAGIGDPDVTKPWTAAGRALVPNLRDNYIVIDEGDEETITDWVCDIEAEARAAGRAEVEQNYVTPAEEAKRRQDAVAEARAAALGQVERLRIDAPTPDGLMWNAAIDAAIDALRERSGE